MAQIDISNEFHLYRYKAGVKLVKPDHATNQEHHLGKDTGYTIGSLLELPFNIGICNADNNIQYVNIAAAASMGFGSEKSLFGKSSNNIYTPEATFDILHNRKEVLTKHTIQITEESLILKESGTATQRLSIRSPWYNDENKVIGLINASITLGKHSLSRALTHIVNMALLQTPQIPKNILRPLLGNIYLTTRERQIAYHLMRGKTAKLISEILFISKRTVEAHIENIKNKFGVYSKPTLIEKIFDYFTDDMLQ